MADLNKVFGVLRVIAMSLSILLAVLVLIMGALVTTFTMKFQGYFIYAAFGIAVASLTIMTVPVMLFISINRKGAFTSMVIIELVWIGLLWILWLAVGGTIASLPWLNYCSSLGYYYSTETQEACMETQAMAAFAFLNWLLLMVLNITLFALAMAQSSRGNSNIWTSYVTEADFSAPAPNAQVPMEAKMDASQGIHPPQQQQPFVPQQLYTPQTQFGSTPQPQYVPQAAQV